MHAPDKEAGMRDLSRYGDYHHPGEFRTSHTETVSEDPCTVSAYKRSSARCRIAPVFYRAVFKEPLR
jgi:hypothetical protein